MASRPGGERGCETGAACKLWFAVVLVLMVGSTEAGRQLQEQKGADDGIRLQAYFDPGCAEARHALPVQSFLVSDGSWVDCVPIEGQIAAHHPSLKDHVIRMAPPRRPRRPSETHPQAFAREHGGCPEGTIPVLRNDPSGKLIKKVAPPVFRRAPSPAGDVKTEATGDSTVQHEYAITGLPTVQSAYSGTRSTFSVNGPTLGSESEMTLSQIWVVDGSYSDNSLSTVEVGWQTQPALHPNDYPDAPHLFVYWTNDAYATAGPGCYNLLCPGFVQQSNTWVIGGVMPSYTTLAENAASESEVTIEVLYSPTDGNWWLYLDDEAVGYWPSSIYVNGYLQGTASDVQWGGEVAITVYTGVAAHSTTAMGSGAFPASGWPIAAYQRNITYFDSTQTEYEPDPTALQGARVFNNPLCYDIQVQLNGYTNWGTYFFFGGPGGGNAGCVYTV